MSLFPAEQALSKGGLNGLPWWFRGKESTCQCRRHGFDPWVRKIPWRRKWQPTSVFLPGKSHGQRSLEGYSLWCRKRVGHDLGTKQQPQQMNGEFVNEQSPQRSSDSQPVFCARWANEGACMCVCALGRDDLSNPHSRSLPLLGGGPQLTTRQWPSRPLLSSPETAVLSSRPHLGDKVRSAGERTGWPGRCSAGSPCR